MGFSLCAAGTPRKPPLTKLKLPEISGGFAILRAPQQAGHTAAGPAQAYSP
jgi:hypothetical protein